MQEDNFPPTTCQSHAKIIEGLNSANDTLDEIQSDVKEIKTFIIGDIKSEKPGAAQRIRSIENFITVIKRASILLVGGIGSLAIYIITQREQFAKIVRSYLDM